MDETENKVDRLIKEIEMLPFDYNRMDIISNFCCYCGKYTGERSCQCWNDE
jgi:hypothetical protein